MSVIGDMFHGIGSLFSGQQASPGMASLLGTVTDQLFGQQKKKKPGDDPSDPGNKPGPRSMTPSFLSQAAMPNVPVPQSNVGGKSLLGQ